jgi:hypothetical protein
MESMRALNSKDKKKRKEWDEMTMQYLIDVHGQGPKIPRRLSCELVRVRASALQFIKIDKPSKRPYSVIDRLLGEREKEKSNTVIYFANYQFSDPECLLNWTTSEKSGIYAILMQDPTSRAKPYKAIFFGESEDISERGFFRSHYRYDRWIREAGSEAELYVSVFPMHDSSPELRQGIVTFLIKYYHPACNF